MNLSKTKYCNAIQCNKMLWLHKNKPEELKETDNNYILDNGTEVGKIARQLLGKHVNIEHDTNLNNMINDTKKYLNEKDITITEASFIYDNNFCSIDLLKVNGNSYEIYEVKSSTHIKDIYLDDISYQYYVLSNLGLNVTKCNIVYINSNYTRIGDLELDKLFVIEDVTDIVLRKQEEVGKKIKEINEYMNQTNEPEERLDLHCKTPYDCPFFEYCSRNIAKPNIFDVRGMRNKSKFELYNSGIYKYQDLLKEDINEKFKQQIEFELYNKEEHIDKQKINEFLSTLSYPLYFLDFETYQQSIPMYDNVKPYMQIPFQYSIHYIEKEAGDLKHTDFLGDGINDPRRELALKLIKDIPKDVCVLAYNMMFEKMVIKNLANLYPDLSEHLMNIYDNMKDLMSPFRDRAYYNKDMHGSYSIKYVLPALFPNEQSLNYNNLNMIHNGIEAMNSYATMSRLDDKKKEILRHNLLKYCELDTFAMFKIYESLRIVDKKDNLFSNIDINKLSDEEFENRLNEFDKSINIKNINTTIEEIKIKYSNINFDNLGKKTPTFILNGDVIYDTFEKIFDADWDYSPAIMQWCRAVEFELRNKIYSILDSPIIRNDNKLHDLRFNKMLGFYDAIKNYKLVDYIFNNYIKNNYSNFELNDFKILIDYVCIVQKYRNDSAHSSEKEKYLNKYSADDCKEYIVASKKILEILSNLKKC